MVFLQILKIIGFILLGIIGLVLLIAGLVLFVPIRYKVRGVKNDNELYAKGEISWLLKLIAINVYIDKSGEKHGIRVAFLHFPREDKEGKAVETPNEETQEPEEQDKNQEKETPLIDVKEDSVAEEKTEETSEAESEQPTEEASEHKEPENRKVKRQRKKKEKKKKELTFLVRIRNVFVNRDYISAAFEKKHYVIERNWKRVVKLLKHIFHGRISGRLAFGFDDPSTTGKVLGIIGALYGRTGELLKISPNFTEKELEGDIKIKGKLVVFTVLLLAALVYFDKELRKLYKYIIHCTEVDIYEEHLEKKEKENGRK